jgi:hypothetical protein
MASEPFHVGAPIEGCKCVDAVFVPDDKYGSVGTWLLEFSNGAQREFHTEAGYYRSRGDFLGCGQWGAEITIGAAELQREADRASRRPRLIQRRAAHWGAACQ